MSQSNSTTDDFIRLQSTVDPLERLLLGLQNLILIVLEDALEASHTDCSSLYLSKSAFVSAEKLGGRYFMRYDLHVKDQEQAKDVKVLRLEFAVNEQKVIESC